MKELFRTVEQKMKLAVDHFHDELKRLRTGRASLGMLEGVTVEYYGSHVPLNQVSNLSVADANLIVAQPFDPSNIPAIQRGITQANLGLNPSSDGKVIRIPVPPLTEDRRKELVRKAHDQAEHARNAVRQARRARITRPLATARCAFRLRHRGRARRAMPLPVRRRSRGRERAREHHRLPGRETPTIGRRSNAR